jgi:PBP1b-binding outer membrane lipoprotein LpoB
MKVKLFLLICLSGLLITGCAKEEECNSSTFENISVLSANVPSTGLVNQDIPIDISFQFGNSCFEFDSFQEIVEGNTRIIKVIARYNHCNYCSQGIISNKKTYSFRTSSPGNYTFNFSQGGNNFISSTLLIQ